MFTWLFGLLETENLHETEQWNNQKWSPESDIELDLHLTDHIQHMT